jgi:hypothetical protein
MTPAIGLIIMVSVFTLGVGLDFWFAFDKVKENTWSEIIRMYAERSILIPYVMGILQGHWLHPFAEGQPFNTTRMFVLVGITAAMIAGSIFIRVYWDPFPNWLLIVTLEIGIFLGMMLWRV